jgi:protein TonB
VSPRDTGVSPAPPTPSRKPAPPASVASSAEGDLGQSGTPAPVSLEQARGPASSQTAAGPSGATRGVAVLARFDPIYPAAALRRRLEGDVTLQIEIDERGSLEHAGVIRSSGYNILDEAAVAAVHKWTFAPAVEDGRPKRANAELPISFRIGAR